MSKGAETVKLIEKMIDHPLASMFIIGTIGSAVATIVDAWRDKK